MKVRPKLLVILAGCLVVACSCPLVKIVTQPTEPAPAAATSTPQLPISTEAPGALPTVASSPTPSVPQVTPISVNDNCQSGPDVAYDAISVLMLGQTAEIVGRNEESTWWYIRDPGNPDGYCWVAASIVTASGNLSTVPINKAAAIIVTDVTVEVNAPSTVYCGGPNPLEFSGTITTNGAAKVKFRWEIGGDKSNTTAADTVNFNDAGTKDVSGPGAYNVDCGTYTITLHVLSPNDVSATKKFKVKP